MSKLVGLVGYPLGHSASPAMHNAAFEILGLPFEYDIFEVKPENLASKIEQLRQQSVGFNVTIPYKEKIMPLLDDVDQLAQKIGAVNTVTNQEGKLTGFNTDGQGFISSLKEDAKFEPKNKSVVVLGAGGASRAVVASLVQAEAKAVIVSDLVPDKARQLAQYFSCQQVDLNSLDLTNVDLLVNATPVGMSPKNDLSPLPDKKLLHPNILVYDLVYNPRKTKLLQDSEAIGAKTCSGLGMLVHQGALAFQLWTGKAAPVEIMRRAAEQVV